MGNFGIETLAAIKIFEYFADSNFAGKAGKGGKGRRLNPKGKDQKIMKCDNCGSEEHLWRACDAANPDEYRRRRQSQM